MRTASEPVRRTATSVGRPLRVCDIPIQSVEQLRDAAAHIGVTGMHKCGASPPFEDVYIRVCAGRITANQRRIWLRGQTVKALYQRCWVVLPRQRALRYIEHGVIVWASATKDLPPPDG